MLVIYIVDLLWFLPAVLPHFYFVFEVNKNCDGLVSSICNCFDSHAFVDEKLYFFLYIFQISVWHVFCVCACVRTCLGYCSQLVFWLLSLALYVSIARETVSLALFF